MDTLFGESAIFDHVMPLPHANGDTSAHRLRPCILCLRCLSTDLFTLKSPLIAPQMPHESPTLTG